MGGEREREREENLLAELSTSMMNFLLIGEYDELKQKPGRIDYLLKKKNLSIYCISMQKKAESHTTVILLTHLICIDKALCINVCHSFES